MIDWLTLEEVAERLRVGKRTVERFIARGELESAKIGRKRVVASDALERYERVAKKRGRVS